MAPDQLSNDSLTFILWSKVSFKLQNEVVVGEIKRLLQELLHHLLTIEVIVVAEHERCNTQLQTFYYSKEQGES